MPLDMVILAEEELVPQLFTALTARTEPEMKLLVKLNCILSVPCPLAMVEPEGATQLYVTPVTWGVV